MVPCCKVRYPNQAVAEIALKTLPGALPSQGHQGPDWDLLVLWLPLLAPHLESSSRPAPWARKGQTGRASGKAAVAKP